MPAPIVAHDADERCDLVPVGEAAGDRAVVGRLVVRRCDGREADGAGAQRVAQLARHRREVVLGGLLLEGALAHGPGAQRGVADVAGVVDALGQPLERVEVLGEGLPGPRRCPRPSPPPRCPRPARGCARRGRVGRLGAGASVNPQLPMTTRGDAVPARTGAERVPGDLRVHVGVPVDEAGRDDLAVGVDLPAPRRRDAADPRRCVRRRRRRRRGTGPGPSRRSRCRCG